MLVLWRVEKSPQTNPARSSLLCLYPRMKHTLYFYMHPLKFNGWFTWKSSPRNGEIPALESPSINFRWTIDSTLGAVLGKLTSTSGLDFKVGYITSMVHPLLGRLLYLSDFTFPKPWMNLRVNLPDAIDQDDIICVFSAKSQNIKKNLHLLMLQWFLLVSRVNQDESNPKKIHWIQLLYKMGPLTSYKMEI